MVPAPVVAPVVIGRRDSPGRLGGQARVCGQRKFCKRLAVGCNTSGFPLSLEREEEKILVLAYRTADRATELLPAKGRLLPIAAVRRLLEVIQAVEGLLPIEKVQRPVILISARCRDYVN